jgi:hypothetical protein
LEPRDDIDIAEHCKLKGNQEDEWSYKHEINELVFVVEWISLIYLFQLHLFEYVQITDPSRKVSDG